MKQARKRTFLVAFLVALVPTMIMAKGFGRLGGGRLGGGRLGGGSSSNHGGSNDPFVQAKKGVVKTDGKNPITYGSIIRLWHRNSDIETREDSNDYGARSEKRYLSTSNDKYASDITDKGFAVFAAPRVDDNSQLWIVKGPHAGDRWNCDFGQIVKEHDIIRLENVGTQRNLYVPAMRFRSPVTKQTEISVHGENGVGDINDSWTIRNIWAGSGGVLNDGTVFNLQHTIFKNLSLHSHDFNRGFFILGDKNKQEVTGFGHRDSNDDWVVELVKTHAQNDQIVDQWAKMRGVELHYNSIVWIDPVATGLSSYDMDPASSNKARINLNQNARRLWTHHASRHDVNNQAQEPHAHKEILAGPIDDIRVSTAASFFLLQKAGDETHVGPVAFGDSIKVLSLAIDPYKELNPVLDPFKVWFAHRDSRFGKDYGEIVVGHPTHPQVKSLEAVFTIESAVSGLTGTIHETDMIQLRNQAQGKPLIWLHPDSRFGNRYYELALSLKGDQWGINHSSDKNERANLFQRFRIHGIIESIVPSDVKPQLAQIKTILERNLGSKAKEQEAELERLRKEKEAADKKAAAELAEKAKADAEKAEKAKAAKSLVEQQLKDLEEKSEQELADTSAKAVDTKVIQDDIAQVAKDLHDAQSASASDQKSLLQEAHGAIKKAYDDLKKMKDSSDQLFDGVITTMSNRFNAALDKAKQDFGDTSLEFASIKTLFEKEKERFAKAKIASKDSFKTQEEQVKPLADAVALALKQQDNKQLIADSIAQAEQSHKKLEANYQQYIADIDKKAEERFTKLQASFDQQKQDAAAQVKALQDQLAAAQKGFDDERKRLEEAAKKPLDTAKIEAQQKIDAATAVVVQSLVTQHYPLGFVDVPGKLNCVAVGGRSDAKNQLVANNWAVGQDGSLLQWVPGAQNPWMVHVAKDEKGNVISKFQHVSAGSDGTVLAVTADGQVVSYSWPASKVVSAPSSSSATDQSAASVHAKKTKKEKKEKKQKHKEKKQKNSGTKKSKGGAAKKRKKQAKNKSEASGSHSIDLNAKTR